MQICIKLFAMIPEKQQPCAFSLGHSGLPGPPPSGTAGHSFPFAVGSAAPPAKGQKATQTYVNGPICSSLYCCVF